MGNTKISKAGRKNIEKDLIILNTGTILQSIAILKKNESTDEK